MHVWVEFFVAIAVCVIILYLPGTALFRSTHLEGPFACACAPFASILGYSLLAITYEKTNIPCTWQTVFLPVLVVSLAALIARFIRAKGQLSKRGSKAEWLVLAAYAAFGLLVCGYVFVKSLDGPMSYYCRFDNQTHYALARHFIDTQSWSVLDTWSGALSETEHTGYYPSAWHATVALIHSITGFDMLVVANALNAVLSGIVFPVGCFAMLSALFPRRHDILVAGVVASMAFACLPWVLLLKGQLLANLIGFALIPPAIALVVHYVSEGSCKHWAALAFLSVCLVADSFFAHPNGLFATIVFLTPYLIHKLSLYLAQHPHLSPRNPLRKHWIVWAAGLLVAYALWQLMLFAPPLQAVVQYNNTGNLNLSWSESVVAATGLSLYPAQPMQWVLFGVCLLGAVAAVRQHRAWLVLPGSWMLFVYAACRCVEAPYALRTFLAGFWYSDPYRILCCAELLLIPLAAMGLASLARLLHQQVKLLSHYPRAALSLALIGFLLLNYAPFYIAPPEPQPNAPEEHFVPTVGTAFGFMHALMTESYSESIEQPYSAEEERFVQKVLEVVPEGALLINQPHDGSAFSYGLNGLNTYYRHIDVGTDELESQLLRASLDQISTNPAVQEAVGETGISYVLQLDHGTDPASINDPESDDERAWLLQSDAETWKNFDGVNRIDDTTPGFELVLSEGDMRLYRIVTPDEA